MKPKSDSKKAGSKNLRAAKKSPVAKAPKVRRDKYRSFSVTQAENESLPARAKKAGFEDVAAFCRFATLGVRS